MFYNTLLHHQQQLVTLLSYYVRVSNSITIDRKQAKSLLQRLLTTIFLLAGMIGSLLSIATYIPISFSH